MKRLKKVLMSTALISSLAFGAGETPVGSGIIDNPGDDITTVTEGKYGQAGVPMEVRVNVIGQGPELVLVDETGTLIENLIFDHGNKLLVTGSDNKKYIAQESIVEKTVILKRTDGKVFGADVDGNVIGAGTRRYTGNFIALSNNPADHRSEDGTEELEKKTHQMTLTRLSSEGTGADKMLTALDYESQDMDVNGAYKEIRTKVVSKIPTRTEANAGLYIGTGTFIGRLTLEEAGGTPR